MSVNTCSITKLEDCLHNGDSQSSENPIYFISQKQQQARTEASKIPCSITSLLSSIPITIPINTPSPMSAQMIQHSDQTLLKTLAAQVTSPRSHNPLSTSAVNQSVNVFNGSPMLGSILPTVVTSSPANNPVNGSSPHNKQGAIYSNGPVNQAHTPFVVVIPAPNINLSNIDLLGRLQSNNSSPSLDDQRRPSPLKSEKEENRRITHNAVERRRRDKINQYLDQLSRCVPLCYKEDGKAQPYSKSVILSKTLEYIDKTKSELRKAQSENCRNQQEREKLFSALQILQGNYQILQKENEYLRKQLKDVGIDPPKFSMLSENFFQNPTLYIHKDMELSLSNPNSTSSKHSCACNNFEKSQEEAQNKEFSYSESSGDKTPMESESDSDTSHQLS